MRSTGEKKCKPMKSSGRAKVSARIEIGSVEVFEANGAVAGITAAARAVTPALTSVFSNTASITRSALASGA